MLSARQAAFEAISSYKKSRAYSEIVLDNLIKKENLSERDASLATSITLGTISNLYYLDYYISPYCNLPLKKLSESVHTILQLSAYQMLFLDKIPAHAAINEGVELTKKYSNERASRLVNAVLRRISENKDSLPNIKASSFEEYISIKYSVEEWIAEKICTHLGQDEAERFFEICSKTPEITINTNTLKISRLDAKKILTDSNIDFEEIDGFPGSFNIKNAGSLNRFDFFKEGLFYVQDISARCAVIASDVKPCEKVLDTCAAPGGKTVFASINMENRGEIISCDIHEKKLSKIEDNVKRLGITIVSAKKADARIFLPEFDRAFDAVIADVPCSGFGVIRKKPEIKYKSDDETKALPDIQLEILKNVSRYVACGGTLVYSTCTVLKRENEDVINRFLEEIDGFTLDAFKINDNISAPDGFITLWPQKIGSDGFFIAKFRRNL